MKRKAQKEPRKIIFLDIDGVLNSYDYCEQAKSTEEYTEINPEKVKLLGEILAQTGAQIVLSSTWRDLAERDGEPEHPMYTYLTDTLKRFGLEILDHTPMLPTAGRAAEIREWLDRQEDTDIRFVSLDDDCPKEEYVRAGIGNCLVRTCFWERNGGLRQEHVEKAIGILNGDMEY